MRRVLFAEPDADSVEKLKRALSFEIKQWDVVFVSTGREAAAALGKGEPFDVIVGEMKLPDMSGIDFFAVVMKRFPQAVRLCLSDSTDTQALFKVSTVTHQFLSKPYEPHDLRTLINRAVAIRDHLNDCPLRKRLHEIGALPSLPVLYQEIMREVHSPEPSVSKVAAIIEKDVAMSAKLLQIVNSAGVGLRNPVSSITQAASLLGLDKLRSMVLLVEVYSLADQKGLPKGMSAQALWDHSLKVAEYSKAIAEYQVEERKIIDDSFMAGLLHDIGLIILATGLPEELGKALKLAKEQGLSLFEAEKEVFGATHAVVGGYLLELWGLPDSIVLAITFHDYPTAVPEEDYPSGLPEHGFTPLTAVHVANYFLEDEEQTKYGFGEPEVDRDHLESLGFQDCLEAWWDACQE